MAATLPSSALSAPERRSAIAWTKAFGPALVTAATYGSAAMPSTVASRRAESAALVGGTWLRSMPKRTTGRGSTIGRSSRPRMSPRSALICDTRKVSPAASDFSRIEGFHATRQAPPWSSSLAWVWCFQVWPARSTTQLRRTSAESPERVTWSTVTLVG